MLWLKSSSLARDRLVGSAYEKIFDFVEELIGFDKSQGDYGKSDMFMQLLKTRASVATESKYIIITYKGIVCKGTKPSFCRFL